MAGKWWVRPVVAMALPIATRWIVHHERRILREGRPLTDRECEGARRIGVQAVDEVRILSVTPVPTPSNRFLTGLAKIMRCPLVEPPGGMALGRGIYLDARGGSFETVLHELVHVRQYQEMGGVRSFLAQYLWECLALSYWESPMEREAVEVSAAVKNEHF